MPRLLRAPSHLFPLVLIAFAGPAVLYVNSVFNTETRWLVLACLFIYLLLTSKLFCCLNGGFGLMLFANIPLVLFDVELAGRSRTDRR
jgi:hypothetical protein